MSLLNYAHPEVLVDTQWVADHLNDPNLRLIEADLDSQAYDAGHIAGAVFWNGFTYLMLPDGRINLDMASLEGLFARSGIAYDSTIIAYGKEPAVGAWIFWLLKALGHRDVRVLNGGRQKWIAQGRPLTTQQPIITPTQYRVTNLDARLRAQHEDVREFIGRTDRVLVDVRSPQEYSGEWFYNKPPEETERAGHIPGAIHVYYELALNEDGTFKSIEQLQALYGSKGITADKEAIAYCAVGVRSGHTWFVLKYLLGYPHVRNYDSSWSEWSRLPDTPVEQ